MHLQTGRKQRETLSFVGFWVVLGLFEPLEREGDFTVTRMMSLHNEQ